MWPYHNTLHEIFKTFCLGSKKKKSVGPESHKIEEIAFNWNICKSKYKKKTENRNLS